MFWIGVVIIFVVALVAGFFLDRKHRRDLTMVDFEVGLHHGPTRDGSAGP